MSYNVFISYSMSDSSWAYDLSAQLGRKRIMCYLDCMESGFSTNEYIKHLVEESQLYVVLAGEKLSSTPYAQSMLRHAIETGKTILAFSTDNTPLAEELSSHAVPSTRETIVADIERLINTTDSADGQSATPIPTDAPATNAEPLSQLVGMINEHKKKEERRKEKEIRKEEDADQEIFDTWVSTILAYSDETEETEATSDSHETPTRTQPSVTPGPEEPEKETGCINNPGCIVLLFFFFLLLGNPFKQCGEDKEREKTPLEQHFEEVSDEKKKEGERLNQLGLIHFEGRDDVRMDRKRGLEYFVQAAELGNVEAMYNAGVCYKMTCRAEHSEEFRTKAAFWLYRATVEGHEKSLEKLIEMAYWGPEFHAAKNNLAICYSAGYGTPRDMEKAIYWYKEAANDGNPHAMSNLAYSYYYGNGVPKDHKKAIYYFEQAALKNLDGAKEKAEKLRNGEKL